MTQEVMIQIFESDFNNDGLVQTVNARDLHVALGVGWDFSTWIKDNLKDFQENQDYVIFQKKLEKSKGRPFKEYALTLDTAKHICMMARCEKGKQLRQYFIEAEKQFRLGHTAAPKQELNISNAAMNAINSITQAALDAIKAIQQATIMQPAIEQHTEPVQALPPTVGVHNPCPANKISLNKMKNYVSNETLLKELINGFGLVGELFDPGCVEGTNKAARPYMVYNKNQVAAMLKAAQVLADKIEGGKRRLLGRTFSVKTNVAPHLYDGFDFDAACEMILLLKAKQC